MTVEECYASMGSDYKDVMRRLGKEERIKRFLVMVLEDDSMSFLLKALKKGVPEDAFQAAHTLKGVCMNLSLTALYGSVSALAEELRTGCITERALALAKQVEKDYKKVTECIEKLKNDKQAGLPN